MQQSPYKLIFFGNDSFRALLLSPSLSNEEVMGTRYFEHLV